jgi:hypothetical protein
MPVILTTHEAEIRKTMAQSQPRPIVPGGPISKNHSQKCIHLVAQGEGPEFKIQYQNKTKQKTR